MTKRKRDDDNYDPLDVIVHLALCAVIPAIVYAILHAAGIIQ